MSLSMYAATLNPLRLMLKNLDVLLAKAEAQVEAKKIEPNAFLHARLFPDMLNFTKQVQIASDNAKGAAARLAGVEIPRFEDTETTFAELHERLARTLAFLDTLTEAQFEGAAGRRIELKQRDRTLEMSGEEYLTTWALPNFFFHVTTAYALLRHNGVEIGKTDYLRGAQLAGH